MCAYQVIDKEYEDVYVYGLELIFSFLISTSIILTIGIVLKQVIPTLTFLVTFILIRQFTGGYHANSYLMCKICTVTCYALSVFLANAVPISAFSFMVLLAIGCLVICLFGPIENIHKPLTSEEKKKHKVTGLSLFIIWILIGFSVSFIMPIISKLIRSDNTILDYLINSKLCALKNTRVVISGSIGDLSDIRDADLACLMGNILDNAIEAVAQVEEKRIELLFSKQNANRIIICKNTIKESVLENNRELRTTKRSGGSHGWGHQIVEKIVSDYHGMIDYFEEFGMFGVQIILPCPIKYGNSR